MILEKINAYHSNQLTWEESVELLLALYPQKSKLISLLFKKRDQYSEGKMRAWVSEKESELKDNAAKANFNTPSQSTKPKINIEILPDELREQYLLQGARIREISSLHARLYNCCTEAQRFEFAKRIINLSDERQAVWNRVDSFMATGNDIQPLQHTNQRAIKGLEKDYKAEYELKLLRTRRTKLKGKPSRVDEYNEVVKRIRELESNRYV